MDKNQPIIKVKRKDGVSARTILIPTVIVVVILESLLVVNMVRISRMGQKVSEITRYNYSYTQAAKGLQSSSGLLADQARLFVSTGDTEYATSYLLDSQGFSAQQDALLAMDGQAYMPSAAVEQLNLAVQAAQKRADLERRVMRLYAEAAGIDLSAWPELASAALADGDAALSPAEQRETAERLLVSADYLQIRSQINDCIDLSIQSVTGETSQLMAKEQATLQRYQMLQWGMVITVIVLISVLFVLLFTLLLGPLERSVEDVQRGETIVSDRGLAEFRRLSFAYNELLHHRKMMENYLRQQSQTDPLTGLPNRLAFQNFISDLSWEKAHSAVIVFSLDVNGLKETNDTRGHTFGDALLKNCAACIQSSLGSGTGKHCFRFGGDEFAAFWVDVPVSELESALKAFEKAQEEQNVSISVGCAYTQDLSETTVDALFEEADKHMYDDKAEYHRRQAQAVLDQLKLLDY